MNNFSSARVENVMNMYRDGQINPPNLAGLLCQEIERQQRALRLATDALAASNQLLRETQQANRPWWLRLRRWWASRK